MPTPTHIYLCLLTKLPSEPSHLHNSSDGVYRSPTKNDYASQKYCESLSVSWPFVHAKHDGKSAWVTLTWYRDGIGKCLLKLKGLQGPVSVIRLLCHQSPSVFKKKPQPNGNQHKTETLSAVITSFLKFQGLWRATEHLQQSERIEKPNTSEISPFFFLLFQWQDLIRKVTVSIYFWQKALG